MKTVMLIKYFLCLLIIAPSAYAIDRSAIVEIAKEYTDAAIASDYVQKNQDLLDDFKKIRKGFENRIKIKKKNCRGRLSNSIAYVKPEGKQYKVFFCMGFDFLPNESLAQTLIHEMSHLFTHSDEMRATLHEALATLFGGRTPELNGYNSADVIFDVIEDLNDVQMIRYQLDYFVLMKVDSKKKLKELTLRTYAVYRLCDDFNKTLNQLCGSDKSCRNNQIYNPDQFGLSISNTSGFCINQATGQQ